MIKDNSEKKLEKSTPSSPLSGCIVLIMLACLLGLAFSKCENSNAEQKEIKKEQFKQKSDKIKGIVFYQLNLKRR